MAFRGDTVTDTLAEVVKADPDWVALPDAAGPRVRELLHRCLQKDPLLRLRDIGDARVLVSEALAGGSSDRPSRHRGRGNRSALDYSPRPLALASPRLSMFDHADLRTGSGSMVARPLRVKCILDRRIPRWPRAVHLSKAISRRPPPCLHSQGQ